FGPDLARTSVGKLTALHNDVFMSQVLIFLWTWLFLFWHALAISCPCHEQGGNKIYETICFS
ncbi:hypothetical protein, partial [Bacillus toyonensis]|uniref:hypothetical protein n=1 Tax=Bacillus toyonensis TaxID=155322 RepID=UPI002E1D0002|nr:hypothetical protein [Bacillus toyonensis]